MALTERDYGILRLLRRFWFCEARQISSRLFAGLDTGAARARLRMLEAEGLVRRNSPKKLRPGRNSEVPSAPPVWVLTVKGSCVLATHDENRQLELRYEPQFTNWMNLWHYVSLADLHMTIDDAIGMQSHIKLNGMYFEHEVLDPCEEGGKKYRLYTQIDEKTVCVPDTAWCTEVNGHQRCWLTEYETGSDTCRRISFKKSRGMAAFISKGVYKKFFPEARDARCICFCPNASFRDALRREFKNKPGKEFWVFVDTSKVTAASLLAEDLVYTVDKGPFRLFPSPPVAHPTAEKGAGVGAGGLLYTEVVK